MPKQICSNLWFFITSGMRNVHNKTTLSSLQGNQLPKLFNLWLGNCFSMLNITLPHIQLLWSWLNLYTPIKLAIVSKLKLKFLIQAMQKPVQQMFFPIMWENELQLLYPPLTHRWCSKTVLVSDTFQWKKIFWLSSHHLEQNDHLYYDFWTFQTQIASQSSEI